jgi:hypothetical protein
MKQIKDLKRTKSSQLHPYQSDHLSDWFHEHIPRLQQEAKLEQLVQYNACQDAVALIDRQLAPRPQQVLG